MKTSTIVIAVLLIIVFGVGIYAFTREPDSSDTPGNQTTAPATSNEADTSAPEGSDNETEDDTEEDASAATIVYTDNGFSNEQTSVPSGSVITITNNSSSDLQFSSDPHPVHTDNSELNAQTIGPGESTTMTVQRSGTWGFHNHDHDAHKGTLIVE